MTGSRGGPLGRVVEGSADPRLRVVLVGFMGCGKTVVGTLLAERLGWALVDLDTRIESVAGRSIPEIFATDGEPTFRDLEHEQLRLALGSTQTVVATGGGAFVAERNRQMLEGRATSVWLAPEFETLLARLSQGERAQRPLFRDPSAARELYHQRAPIYALADHRVEVGASETPTRVAARIESLIRDSEPHKH